MTIEVENSYEKGFWEGHNQAHLPIPDWYFTKKLCMLKAEEVGFFVGRQIALLLQEEPTLSIPVRSCCGDLEGE